MAKQDQNMSAYASSIFGFVTFGKRRSILIKCFACVTQVA